MTKQFCINQPENYEQLEAARRHDFIERMEQKLQSKLQALREQQPNQTLLTRR